MRRLGKKSKNSSTCTKRWSDHELEQLIDLKENSCLWDVSNKDYYFKEKTWEGLEEKLGTERAVFKVTVQFETEGSGQNDIVSHMDKSEVKL